MKILMVAPQVPWPPHQGTTIRNYHLARELARRHEVTVLGFGDPSATFDPLHAAGIATVAVPPPPGRTLARRTLDLISTGVPDLARRLDDPAMVEAIAELTRHGAFDVVQIEGLEMARHGLAAHRRLSEGGPKPRLVYDAHNAEWVLQDRAWRADIRRPRTWPGALYSAAQTIKLRRFERRLLAASDATICVSEADARALRPLARGAEISVVPNGVDTDAIRPTDRDAEIADTCAFIGKMDFRPNIDAVTWFCRTTWPSVRAHRPEARFWIVGRSPSPRVEALHDEDVGVVVTGGVPDVRPWLEKARVIVVPLRIGGGTRLKVLEAMAAGKAIAATRMAVEGIDMADGRHALLADEGGPLAAAILRLFDDEALRLSLGRRARSRVEERYDWRGLVPRIEARYGDR